MPYAELQRDLNERTALGLLRQRQMLQSPQSPYIVVGEKPYLAFCSNDYLGLSNHPQLIAALQQGAAQYGVGAGAAHLVSGHGVAHHQLEQALAVFADKPAALLFSTGYMANLGTVQALVGKGDTVFADKLNHASLNDAMLLSRATVKRYRHNDMAQLAQLLEQAESSSPDTEGCNPLAREGQLDEQSRTGGYRPPCHARRRKLVITDAVFSMDGNLAPLPELLALCERHDAWLLIDDAHGFGVLGEQGRGSLAHFGIASERIIYMATLGKATGVFGAFVAAEQVVTDTLINHARSYVYTTATPPALASAVLESLKLIGQGDALREHLRKLIAQLRNGLAGLPWKLMPSDTAIQPLLIGDNQAALALSEALRKRGIWVAAIRPPTIPQGTARLRITLSAAHSADDVARLVEALHELAQ
ncbi:MAG: 8-amino-7-oxononanoate synthase [Gallionellales bacterium GWA2_55_18]|nr:MAG: 8-amino-7-oxononanoate synthase [Gallionellales bacterium GWA2_55_18]